MLSAWLARPRQLFYGWRIVAVGCVFNALGSATLYYTVSVLFLPVSAELGLSRAAMSLIISLSRAEGAFEGPLAGWFVDRYGPKPLLFFGAVVAGLGYILLSQANSFLTFLLIYMGVISVGSSAGFYMAVLAAVNNWFVRRRGLAIAVVASSLTGGGAFIVPFFSQLVHRLGWRPSVVIVGLVIIVVLAPLSFLVRRSPESMGLRPDGNRVEPEAPTGRPAAITSVDFTIKETLRTAAYWILVLATGLRLAVFGTVMLHFIPIMVWKGTSEQAGATIMGVILFVAIPIRLFMGWLGDRWSRPRLVSILLLIGTASLLVLLWGQATWHIWLGAILLGLMEGLPPLNWALIGDFFGRKRFATLRGILSFFTTWFSIFFPVYAGFVYDRTKSYNQVLIVFAILSTLSAVAFFWLRPPRRSPSA